MSNRITMTVTMEVTIPQALALQAMFKYWNFLSAIGSSRSVGFFVDGDGNFHPKCKMSFDNLNGQYLPELTEELEKLATIADNHGDKTFDYDGIAWKLRKS